MNREKLAKIGLDDEQINLILKDFEGNFIPKARFNEVNSELKQLRESLKERDSQLDDLNLKLADSDTLKAQIDELKLEYEAKLKEVKLNSIVSSELMKAKAKNITATKALLSEFLGSAEVDGDGIKGLGEQIRGLIESEDTKFLFEHNEESKSILKGFAPSESKDGTPSTGNPQTLAQAIKMQIESS